MIKRYSTKEQSRIWSERSKFSAWLRVELAVIKARVKLGLVSKEVYDRIKAQAKFTVKRIEELDAILKHDMLAFVGAVQESLDADLRRYFHSEVTSYDIEEPATALLLRRAMKAIFQAMDKLGLSLRNRAEKHKNLLKIHRTHGQHAEPTTLGLELLWWYDVLERQEVYLQLANGELRCSKISGAVGTYSGGLSPEIERLALAELGLEPARISAQIILRDRHAHLTNALAVLAGVIEHMASNLRLYGQTEIREIQEPFGKDQKGSSRMPHKKNTILTENLCGQSRLARGYAGVELENIATWGARDISHSAPERVIIPDMFQVIHFMLRRMNGIIEKMVVNENQIKRNLEMTCGVIFSPDVKELLLEAGVETERAYRISQEDAFMAFADGKEYLEILLADPEVPADLKQGKLQAVFNLAGKVKSVDHTFAAVLGAEGA